MDERKELNELNKEVRFDFKGAISSTEKKVCLLLQCCIDRVKIKNWEL
jgi:Sec63 Brl domain